MKPVVKPITKEEFIADYRDSLSRSWVEIQHTHVVLPCNCGEGNCRGWAVIRNTPEAISDHDDLCHMRLEET